MESATAKILSSNTTNGTLSLGALTDHAKASDSDRSNRIYAGLMNSLEQRELFLLIFIFQINNKALQYYKEVLWMIKLRYCRNVLFMRSLSLNISG